MLRSRYYPDAQIDALATNDAKFDDAFIATHGLDAAGRLYGAIRSQQGSTDDFVTALKEIADQTQEAFSRLRRLIENASTDAPLMRLFRKFGELSWRPGTIYNCVLGEAPVASSQLRDSAVAEINQISAGTSGLPPLVMVEWGGRWWKGRVLAQSERKLYVHYVGYDESWDEWVDASRVRERTAAEREPAPGDEVTVAWDDGETYRVRIVEVDETYYGGTAGIKVRWLSYGYDSWIRITRIVSTS
jgi:hypothetical protein